MAVTDFNSTLDRWIHALEQNTFDQLRAKPSPTSWSLGQVYMHLLSETTHFLNQSKICLSSNDHSTDEMSAEAKVMFRNNDFPDEIIEGPASNANTPQPGSKEELHRNFLALRDEINRIQILISKNLTSGKTKHPGLNYFNAQEWFQFAEMHFRHHLRQRKRIEEFLNTNRST